jgi:anti-sigma factor RsiW
MTHERIEELLSAYLEGDLSPEAKAEADAHLAACHGCAELAGLMEKAMAAGAAFPEADPSPGLLGKLYAIPEERAAKKRLFHPVFDWLTRPALQPVYAALTGVFIVLSFVLFHPEGRGIRKKIDIGLHRGAAKVERLWADAGTIKGEVGAFAGQVIKSFDTLGLLGGNENKQ